MPACTASRADLGKGGGLHCAPSSGMWAVALVDPKFLTKMSILKLCRRERKKKEKKHKTIKKILGYFYSS